MQILVMGGTGAMGIPTVSYCAENAEVFVTSRNIHDDSERIHYICGNAHSVDFLLEQVFCRDYDVIIDFMSYSTEEFRERVDILLGATRHYVFLSSGRVYADKQGRISESDPRILDISKDTQYLKTDEYALSKARCEDILKTNRLAGWTIVRPYITYNSQRIQLGVYEKENWLRRFIDGHTIVLTEDILSKRTTLSFGDDVAYRLSKIALNEETIGQVYNVSNSSSITWKEVFDLYDDCLCEITGKRMKTVTYSCSNDLQKVWNKYQIIYDRLYNREFDNSKQEKICGTVYKDLREGIMECLKECITKPAYVQQKINGAYEGWSDKLVHEISPLTSIPGGKNKVWYIKHRTL